jgi:hypothetical protein
VAQVGPDDIAGTVPAWDLTFIQPGSADVDRVPEPWRPIAASPDPRTRLQTALAQWNASLLDAMPQFAAALRTRFIDVRACVADYCAVLVYVATADAGRLVSWVGYDPRSFGDPPLFWDDFPGPLRVFLRLVHAGFVSDSRTSFGPARPMHMETLASLADEPDGIPDWDEVQDIPSTRLLRVTSDGGLTHYCVSPDLPPGKLAVVYEGEIDPLDFGDELDKLLMMRFHV